MESGPQHSDAVLGELIQALQQWQANPQATASTVRNISDREEQDARLAALAAMLTAQAGAWQEGLPYVRRAAAGGVVSPLNHYFGQMLNDANLQPEGLEFMAMLLDAGWPIDPFAYVPALIQAGHPDLISRLLDLGSKPPPSGARLQWEQLLAETRTSSAEVSQAANAVNAERDRAIDSIRQTEDSVAAERARMAELVAEVADLANDGAARHLAKEYATQAAKVETTAHRYTVASLAVGSVAAIATCVIAYFAFTLESGTGAILTRAALALPILAFAAYIAGLATTHRKQAWRWRHIELQIRTARPFVSPLDEGQRKTLIAALALRFFPGQHAHGAEDLPADASDPVAVLGELLKEQGPNNGDGSPGSASDGQRR